MEKQIRILFCSEGKGSGHAKRINAILNGFQMERIRVVAHAYLPGLINTEYLCKSIELRNKETINGSYDFVFIDQRPSKLCKSLFLTKGIFIQPCKELCERESPDGVFVNIHRLSIEDCNENRMASMPYFGELLDINLRGLLSCNDAKTKIVKDYFEISTGHNELILVQVNTSEPTEALRYVQRCMSHIEKRWSKPLVLVASVHYEFISQNISFSLKGTAFSHIPNLYRYFNAFDVLYSPSSYNSYYESQLLFKGKKYYSSIFNYEMPLRLEKKPCVQALGNQDFAKYCMALL